jgi:sugar lactone lactonase YvrE
MKDFSAYASRTMKSLIAILAVLSLGAGARVSAQAPYALPYTISVLAGGGTAVNLTAPATASCVQRTTSTLGYYESSLLTFGSSLLTYDDYGDGCQDISASLVLGFGITTVNAGDQHDIGVDAQGNIYFLNYNASSKALSLIERIDARSGVMTVAAGSTSTTVCTGTSDKYGDGCTATDGHANISGGYTYLSNQPRGMGVARNGDIVIGNYSTSVVSKVSAATGLMTKVAGFESGTGKSAGGSSGFGGNGALATASTVYLKSPRNAAEDNAGNIYIDDTGNNEVREVYASSGIINVIAGSTTAIAGSTGDGSAATAALVSAPEGLDVDAAGDVFIGDFGNTKVRVIYEGGAAAANLIAKTNSIPVSSVAIGSIYTVYGGGAGTLAAAGTYANGTSLSGGNPRKLHVDAMGNVYIADSGNDVIEFLDAATGYAHVIAGTYGLITGGTGCTPAYGNTDTYGDNCPATLATLSPNSAMSVTVDASENLYITDSGDYLVRKVSTNRDFPLVAAGSSVTQKLDIHFAPGDSPAASSPFTIGGNSDFSVGTPACTTNADTTQDCLVPVTFAPTKPGLETASLLAASTNNGTSAIGLDGEGSAAAVAFDPGTVTAFTGSLNTPLGAAVDGAGNTYVADTGNNRVVVFSPAGVETLVAGTGTAGYTGDNSTATLAKLSGPSAVAVTPGGMLYIADTGNNVIRLVNLQTGVITTVAGGGSSVCGIAIDTKGDGCIGTSTTFSKPAGLVADIFGNVYVADTGNNLIREINPQGYVSLIAGGASAACTGSTDSYGEGCNPLKAVFSGPTGLAIDSQNNIYIADTGDNEIRKIVASTNLMATVAGTGVAGSGNSTGLATGAQVNAPTGVAIDGAGNLYIGDTGNQAVRLVPSGSGYISTIVGTIGSAGTGTGSAGSVLLTNPRSVAVLNSGNVGVLDSGNNRLVLDNRGGVNYNFGRTNIGFSSPTLTIQETEIGPAAATIGSPLLTASGSSSYFTVTGSGTTACSTGTLTVGESCTFSAYFTPTAPLIKDQSVNAAFTEANTNAVNALAPYIDLSGLAAVLTTTSSSVVLTNPSVTPQYAVPFSVNATVTASSCNTDAPNCYPTGYVQFYVDGALVGQSQLATGTAESATATLSIASPLNVGQHQIYAVYEGDFYYASDTSLPYTVTITTESTTSAASATPNPVAQFNQLTLSAKISSFSGNPTGTFSFYAGSTLLGTAGVNAATGVATLNDTLVPAAGTVPAYYYNFGLGAGTYQIKVVYSGDSNYSASTSPNYQLQITAVPQSFAAVMFNPATDSAGSVATTYPGASTALELIVTPSNTLSGTMTFKCTNMPADTDCGFSPTTFTFTPTTLMGSPQYTQVTFWTNVNPAVVPSSLGKNLLLFACSCLLLFGLRRRARKLKLLLMIPALGLALSVSAMVSGCSAGNRLQQYTTALGTYNVNVVATGPNGQVLTLPVTFNVASATTN